jgi:hypothetical protein
MSTEGDIIKEFQHRFRDGSFSLGSPNALGPKRAGKDEGGCNFPSQLSEPFCHRFLKFRSVLPATCLCIGRVPKELKSLIRG